MRTDLEAQEIVYYNSWLKNRIDEKTVIEEGFDLLPPQHPILVEVAANLSDGEEPWRFSSSPEHWDNLIDEYGLAIAKEGAVIAVEVLFHN